MARAGETRIQLCGRFVVRLDGLRVEDVLAGAKGQAIRDRFDMGATGYYQVLNTLLDNPAALEADPMLVKRLRRMRAARQRARSARRLGIEL